MTRTQGYREGWTGSPRRSGGCASLLGLGLVAAGSCMTFDVKDCQIRCGGGESECLSGWVCEGASLRCVRESSVGASGSVCHESMDASNPTADAGDIALGDADAGLPAANDADASADEDRTSLHPKLDATADAGDAATPPPCPEYPSAPQPFCLADGVACFEPSAAMRDALVLWLAPGALPEPPVDSFEYWCDVSGYGNHAFKRPNPRLLPVLQEERTVSHHALARVASLEGYVSGNWLLVEEAARSLTFGEGDFSLWIVASVPNGENPETREAELLTLNALDYQLRLFGDGEFAQVDLHLVEEFSDARNVLVSPVGGHHIYVVRRVAGDFELRVDGVSDRSPFAESTDLASSARARLMLGTSLGKIEPSGAGAKVAFVAAFGDATSEQDVMALEAHLCAQLSICQR